MHYSALAHGTICSIWADLRIVSHTPDDNKDKEIEGLMEAMLFFNLEKGLILTYNQEDEFHVENKYVEVKPIWKWL